MKNIRSRPLYLLYILYPVLALLLPAGVFILAIFFKIFAHWIAYGPTLSDLVEMPIFFLTFTALLLYEIVFEAWPTTVLFLFSNYPLYLFIAYPLLLASCIWWYKQPKWLSGIAFFLISLSTGPTLFIIIFPLFGIRIPGINI